jgi:cytochrome c oxidase cbb3-type subunit 3
MTRADIPPRPPFLLFVLSFALATVARGQVVENTAPPSTFTEGARLFQMHCATCHGAQGGGGRGPALAVPKLTRAPDAEALIKIVKSGISGTEMPRFKLLPNELDQLAGWVLQLGRLPPERVKGNAQRGSQLFATKGACAQCHSVDGYGGAVGPDLTEIGLRRGAAYLRTALVDPSADVPKTSAVYRQDVSLSENFLMVRIVTKDGRAFTGVRVNEDTFSLQLRDLANGLHSFYKSELAELHKDWGQSPMPSYRAVFSDDELDDLVAYLASLKGSP